MSEVVVMVYDPCPVCAGKPVESGTAAGVCVACGGLKYVPRFVPIRQFADMVIDEVRRGCL